MNFVTSDFVQIPLVLVDKNLVTLNLEVVGSQSFNDEITDQLKILKQKDIRYICYIIIISIIFFSSSNNRYLSNIIIGIPRTHDNNRSISRNDLKQQ